MNMSNDAQHSQLRESGLKELDRSFEPVFQSPSA